jgi:hypothetical protein
MDHGMGCVLRARTQMQDRKDFRTGVDGQPQPQDAAVAPQPRPQLIQLEIGKLEVTENVFVQGLSVRALASQPGGDGGLSIAEDPLGSRRIQSFSQRREHHGNLLRRGFQPVQGGVESSTEGGVASLTTKGLNLLGTAMLAIPNQSVHLSVSVAKVRALPVRTGEPFGGYAFGGSPAAFHLRPRTYGQRCWPSTHRGSGGVTTGGAIVWRARLEQTWERSVHLGCSRLDRTMMGKAVGTKQRQREDEQEHEQKHMDVHEAFSLLDNEEGPFPSEKVE